MIFQKKSRSKSFSRNWKKKIFFFWNRFLFQKGFKFLLQNNSRIHNGENKNSVRDHIGFIRLRSERDRIHKSSLSTSRWFDLLLMSSYVFLGWNRMFLKFLKFFDHFSWFYRQKKTSDFGPFWMIFWHFVECDFCQEKNSKISRQISPWEKKSIFFFFFLEKN